MDLLLAATLGLIGGVLAATFSLPLPLLVLSYLVSFLGGFAIGHWQRTHDS